VRKVLKEALKQHEILFRCFVTESVMVQNLDSRVVSSSLNDGVKLVVIVLWSSLVSTALLFASELRCNIFMKFFSCLWFTTTQHISSFTKHIPGNFLLIPQFLLFVTKL
jgi:hypothetical protein